MYIYVNTYTCVYTCVCIFINSEWFTGLETKLSRKERDWFGLDRRTFISRTSHFSLQVRTFR